MRRSWINGVLKQRLIVHTKSDQSLDGHLVAVMKDGIVLRASKLLNPAGNPTPMAGEVWIPRENVAFVQNDD